MKVIVNDSRNWSAGDHHVVDHASHLSEPVALGSQAGLVVISCAGSREKDDRSGEAVETFR
jgi:hypothetical protein